MAAGPEKFQLVRIFCAGNVVERAGERQTHEKKVIVVVGIAVLKVFAAHIFIGHAIQIIEEGLPDSDLKGHVPLGIKHVFHPTTKRDRHLHAAVPLVRSVIATDAKYANAAKEIGSKAQPAFAFAPIQKMVFKCGGHLHEKNIETRVALCRGRINRSLVRGA